MRTIPSVWRGKPEAGEQAEYQEIKVDGVTVFAHQSLEAFELLEVTVDESFFGKKLVLRGAATEESSGCCG